MTLRSRLFLLVAGSIAVAVALVTWTVSASARQAFESADQLRADALVAQFRRELAEQADDVARRVEGVAGGDALQRTATEIDRRPEDYARFVNDAASIAASQGLDFLDLTTEDGTIVSSAEWPARFGHRHSWIAAARTAGDARAQLRVVELPRETALGLIAVRRAKAASRPLYVAGGRALDRQFLKSLVLPSGTRALLYRNVEPEVSRQQLVDATGSVGQVPQLEPMIARVRQTGRDATDVLETPDGAERFDAIPLAGVDGGVPAVLLIGSSRRELAALVSRIRWSGLGFGSLGIALGLALSYALAARVTQPVEQLAGAARSVAAGDWSVRVDEIRAGGEIGALAGAFDAMTRQLVDQRDRLVQAERVAAWRELARRLAHELKNPLFPLRVTIDNLRRARTLPPGEFDEVFVESLDTLTSGLANLTAVVGRFSDFSRMPAPEFAAASPRAIVQKAAALFKAQLDAAAHAPIELVVDLDPSDAPISVDAEQLTRAIQNLLVNAIDAMPNGGRLTLTSRRRDGAFRLEVADTGEGLTDEECRRLFTPYYTTKQHGTGLGLAIVQSVVADHGGTIRVESAPGHGTTFHIELPETRESS